MTEYAAMRMLKYLVPQIALGDLPSMCRVSAWGALITGIYGVVHDEITYSISPEYFTHLKFQQFHYADLGLGNRVFAATIGFLAASSVGLIGTWFLARRLIPGQPRARAYRQICLGFASAFACGIVSGLVGFAYGLWRGPDADYSSWAWAFDRFAITDPWSFVRVAYIHNASYVGAAIGLVVALTVVRPRAVKRPIAGPCRNSLANSE